MARPERISVWILVVVLVIVALVLGVLFLVVGSSRDETVAVRGDNAGGDGGWWVFEASGFSLMDGGLADEAIAASTGAIWSLEYSDGRQTMQLSAYRTGSQVEDLVRRSPEIGSAMLDGFDVTLRLGPGIPDDDIPPSVGADWTDGDVYLTFGGGGLTEVEVRQLLLAVRRVHREDWNAQVKLPEPVETPSTTNL